MFKLLQLQPNEDYRREVKMASRGTLWKFSQQQSLKSH